MSLIFFSFFGGVTNRRSEGLCTVKALAPIPKNAMQPSGGFPTKVCFSWLSFWLYKYSWLIDGTSVPFWKVILFFSELMLSWYLSKSMHHQIQDRCPLLLVVHMWITYRALSEKLVREAIDVSDVGITEIDNWERQKVWSGLISI